MTSIAESDALLRFVLRAMSMVRWKGMTHYFGTFSTLLLKANLESLVQVVRTLQSQASELLKMQYIRFCGGRSQRRKHTLRNLCVIPTQPRT